MAAALEIKQIRFTRTKEFPPDPPIFPFPDKISAKKKQRPQEGVRNNLKKYNQSIVKLACIKIELFPLLFAGAMPFIPLT